MTAKPKELKEAIDSARRWCSQREMSAREIQKKLARYELSPEDQSQIIARLKEERFLDEYRYARAFVNDKSKIAGWGPVKIKQGLMLKGIPTEIISEVLADLKEAGSMGKLVEIATRKLKSIKGETNFEKRNKLIRFLLGRGFNFDDCLKVAENLLP